MNPIAQSIRSLREASTKLDEVLHNQHKAYVEHFYWDNNSDFLTQDEHIILQANKDFPSNTAYGSTDFYKICQVVFNKMPPAVACLVGDKILKEKSPEVEKTAV
jgi:hypothetical protein